MFKIPSLSEVFKRTLKEAGPFNPASNAPAAAGSGQAPVAGQQPMSKDVQKIVDRIANELSTEIDNILLKHKVQGVDAAMGDIENAIKKNVSNAVNSAHGTGMGIK